MKRTRAAAVLLAAVMSTTVLSGCSSTDNAALINVNGGKAKITYGYANFYARYTQALYDLMYASSTSADMWSSDSDGDGKTMEDNVKESVIDALETGYVMREHAGDYDVSLSDDDKTKIKETAKAFIKANSDAALKQLGASESYVEEYLTDALYKDRMKSAIEAAADDTVTDEEANQKKISYVHFSTQPSTDSSGNTTTPTDDDIQKYKSEASLLSEASDFAEEAKTLGLTSSSYVYGQAEVDAAKDKADGKDDSSSSASSSSSSATDLPYDVLEAAEALSDGQTSTVVEIDDDGYYVVHMEETTDADATQSKKVSMAEDKRTDYYNDTVKDWKKDNTWKISRFLWKRVRFIDRFTGNLFDEEDTGSDPDASGSSTTSTDSTTDSTGDSTTTTDGTTSDNTAADGSTSTDSTAATDNTTAAGTAQ